jgi:kinesin family protein C1
MTLEQERLQTTTELVTKKEELLSVSKELVQVREQLEKSAALLLAKEGEISLCKDACVALEVEKEIRSRAETREENERTERIAACAQLLATQIECNSRLRECETKMVETKLGLQQEINSLTQQRDEVVSQTRLQGETIVSLESETAQIREALAAMSAEANKHTHTVDTDAVEKLAKMTGELEIMRRRMNDMLYDRDAQGSIHAGRLKELEDRLKAEEIARRKLHNVIQELRGNVRVFARVRPFLPNDGLSLENLPEPSIQVCVLKLSGRS